MKKPLIAITMGDPTGIGPEIIASALADPYVARICRPLVIGDSAALERALAITGARLHLVHTREGEPLPEVLPGTAYLRVLTSLDPADMVFGRPTAAGGDPMFRYIAEAGRLCLASEADAMVTAPINKEAMNLAGHSYPGHTELLAEMTGTREFVMMLAGTRLRISLVTIHEALRDVPQLVTIDRVLATIRVTYRDLDRYFVKNPRLAVLALNPHCGEGGMFGDEEARVIRPAVEAAGREGIDVTGPLSADTLFHFAAQGAGILRLELIGKGRVDEVPRPMAVDFTFTDAIGPIRLVVEIQVATFDIFDVHRDG